jgi:acetyl esterase/lipase
MIENFKYLSIFKFILTVFIFCSCENKIQTEYPIADWSDVDYSGNNHISQKMDIYLPKNNNKKHPLVIVVYGSGWSSNNKKLSNYQKDVFVKPLSKKGFATISINHRSSRLDSVFPAQIHDVKAVIRFLRANHLEYKLDTSFIGIAGYSSGGHLAALAGTSSNNSLVAGDVGNYLEYDTNVNAVVDFYGPTDLNVFYECPITKDKNLSDEQKMKVFGDVDNISEVFDLANPINYIDKDTPPFLIIHGEKDEVVPVCQSKLLHEALLKSNLESELILKEDGDHNGNTFIPNHTTMMANFFYNQYNKQL